jgi:hypothetical protein
VGHAFTDRPFKRSLYRPLAAVCLLAVLCLPVWSYAQSVSRPQEQVARLKSEEQPTAPAPPAPTLQQMPSRPPTVTYHNGQLSIVAHNATLREILEMVRSQTGATIDIPPGANERVVVRLGPGPAPQVLAALLTGSDFNFVVLSSDRDSQAVAVVVLSPKTGTAAGEAGSPATPNGISSAVVRRRPGT